MQVLYRQIEQADQSDTDAIEPLYPRIGLPTKAGDVTVHVSCTLHMSQPPVTRERRVVYTDFSLFDPGDVSLSSCCCSWRTWRGIPR